MDFQPSETQVMIAATDDLPQPEIKDEPDSGIGAVNAAVDSQPRFDKDSKGAAEHIDVHGVERPRTPPPARKPVRKRAPKARPEKLAASVAGKSDNSETIKPAMQAGSKTG